jgi:uncharacterized protein YegJ (DUF2314 family)
MNKKLALTSLAIACLAFSAHAQEGKIGDQVCHVSAEDRAMLAAIAHAQDTLDQFLTQAKNPPPGSSNFKLRVMVSEEDRVEHLWFTPFKEVPGDFAGVLANEPTHFKSMQQGAVYGFRKEQITDWGYVQDGKQKGSLTICVLFQNMDKATVDRYKKDHGFECD